MRGLRIGYVVQEFPPDLGAGPARVSEMAQRWRAAGAEVTVITALPHRPQNEIHPEYRGRRFLEEERDGIRVLRSWLYASPQRGAARKMLSDGSFMLSGAAHALARAPQLDVVIASAPPFLAQFAAEALHRKQRIPMVVELRDLWPDYMLQMGMLKSSVARRALFGMERHLLRRAAHVVVVTESFRARVAEKGVPRERITVIPNGVDISQYHPATEEPPLPALQRSGDELVVGYLGNFGAGQGLATVVEAASLLQGDAGIRLVLVGDGPERQRVTELVERLGLRNLTVHGSIPRNRTRAFYNACDACLVPLAPIDVFQETIPSKIFEIMACGRPVVASVAGEAARIVESSHCGVVSPPGDPVSLAEAIRRVRNMPVTARAEMGERGRVHALEHNDRSRLADRYLDLLGSVGGAAHPGRVSAAEVSRQIADRSC